MKDTLTINKYIKIRILGINDETLQAKEFRLICMDQVNEWEQVSSSNLLCIQDPANVFQSLFGFSGLTFYQCIVAAVQRHSIANIVFIIFFVFNVLHCLFGSITQVYNYRMPLYTRP